MEAEQIFQYIATGSFYLVTGVLGFLGAFGVYVYIRYAKNPIIAVVVSVLFGFMFLLISGNALSLLEQ